MKSNCRTHLMYSAYRKESENGLKKLISLLHPTTTHVHLDHSGPFNYDGYITRTGSIGKKGYTKVVTTLFERCRNINADRFLFFQDDIDLLNKNLNFCVNDFFAINLFKECGHNSRDGWSCVRPSHYDEQLNKVGWIDCAAFICTRQALEKINYSVPDYPVSRWESNPQLSSGVGLYLSQQWQDGLFQVKKSHVKHDISTSTMNPDRRDLCSFPTSEQVTGIMATTQSRSELIHNVINSIQGQVHQLKIYSDYMIPNLPDWCVLRVGENLGDRARWVFDTKGYVVTFDDDIIYPKDYSLKMLQFLNSHNNQAVVGVHGRVVINKLNSYFSDTQVIHFTSQQDSPQQVQFIGMGTCCYHTDFFCPKFSDYPTPNISDIYSSVMAKKLGLPMFLIPRENRWLKPLKTQQSIYDDRFLYLETIDRVLSENRHLYE